MAAETPFGASFGDPRRYMGQSPLAEIGKGLKQGLTAYALKESGFTDYLNSLNKKPVQGAVAPVAPVAPAAVQPPQTPFTPSFVPVAPSATPQPSVPAVQNDMPPPDIGEQILNGTWTGVQAAPQPAAPVSLQNPTDFNPLAPDTSNQFAVSGNDYQQVPGYGKLQKIAGMLMGMG
jgi:hypothetical protein